MATINEKVASSTRWTFITEVMAKIVNPISNMILARLLAPEAFGVLATVLMILSFADMLADAGFQKYIIQKEFKDGIEREQSTLVAIWSNIALGCVLWIGVLVFQDKLASLVGNPGLGNVLAIAGIAIPLTSISSVQLALLRRDFNFKALFVFRLCVIIVPLLITVPLAYFGYGYWSLIIGHIAAQALLAITVTKYSEFHLRLYYNINQLLDMLSFSIWTLIESIAIWLTSWVDIFIVSSFFTAHYLGLYRMSMVAVNGLLAVVSGAIVPVLYSALSRLQTDNEKFTDMFYYILKRTALLVIPLGIGLYVYKDLARSILFGAKWYEADMMIGLWGLTSCLAILYCHFCSELYRAKGAPKVSFLAQVMHMAFLIPIMYYFSRSFEDLVYVRNLARLQFILVHFLLVYIFFKVSPVRMFTITLPYIGSGVIMACFAYYSRSMISNVFYDYASILLCVLLYFGCLYLIQPERKMLGEIIKKKSLY
ncbi:oligosaccharide flippase family protein [Phascolarctobacterium sp.]